MINTSWLIGGLLWEFARYMKAVYSGDPEKADLFGRFYNDDPVLAQFAAVLNGGENNAAAKIISHAAELAQGNAAPGNSPTTGGEGKQNNFPALVSILSTLPVNGKYETVKRYHPLHDFKEAGSFTNNAFIDSAGVAAHLAKFTAELSFLAKKKAHYRVDTLTTLVEKYGSCLPLVGAADSDAPIANISKMAAAYMACWKAAEDGTPIVPDAEEKCYALLQGDLSGIQNYIYRIASAKGVAKGLKGRSFEVSLLTDTIIAALLHKYQLPRTQVVYNSGGGFLVLLPASVVGDIPAIHATLEKACFKRYDGEIYLALGVETVSGKALSAEGFTETRRSVREICNQNKRRKFATMIESDYAAIFEVKGIGKAEPTCDMCGREATKDAPLKKLKIDETQERELCAQCENLENAGKILSRAAFLVEVIDESKRGTGNIARLQPLPLETYSEMPAVVYYIVPRNKMAAFQGKTIRYISLKIAVFDASFTLADQMSMENSNYSYRFYGGNSLPEKGKEPLNYDDMFDISQGVKRLGILRMDVDNLGAVFRGRSPGEEAAAAAAPPMSPARISALSNAMDRFFARHVNDLRNLPAFKDNVMIVYSGGDDLFAVGSWNRLVDFGSKLQKRFVKFVANRNLTLSGGMAMVPKKFPIHRGAEIAGAAESAAKQYVAESEKIKEAEPEEKQYIPEKDAFTFLDKSMRWEDFHIAESIAKALEEAISLEKTAENKTPLSKGVLNRLRQIFSLYEQNRLQKEKLQKRGKISRKEYQELILYDKWRWRLTYTMSRFADNNEAHEQLVKEIQFALLMDNWKREEKRKVSKRNIIDFIDVAARWAEFLTRVEKE